MHILVITPFFHPHSGGSQTYIEELYVALRNSHPDVDVDVLCYNTDNAPEEESYRGLHIYRVGCVQILTGQFALPNPLQLIKVLKKLKETFRYDVVNSHTRFFDNSWWAPLAAKYLNARSILTDHCAEQPKHSFFMVNFISGAIDTFLFPIIAPHYDHVTSVSKATRYYLSQHGVKHSTVIYPGMNSKQISNSPKNGNKNKIIISFVGRMIPSKGPGLFLETMSNLLPTHSHIEVYVAGTGPLLPALKNSFRAKQIHFTDQLTHQQVTQLLRKTDILVLPSTHHEGFPVTLLEAASASCAVITTNRGGTSEIITNRKTGLLIEPTQDDLKSAVELLISNSKLRKQLAKNLHTFATVHFSWKKSAEAFYALL